MIENGEGEAKSTSEIGANNVIAGIELDHAVQEYKTKRKVGRRKRPSIMPTDVIDDRTLDAVEQFQKAAGGADQVLDEVANWKPSETPITPPPRKFSPLNLFRGPKIR